MLLFAGFHMFLSTQKESQTTSLGNWHVLCLGLGIIDQFFGNSGPYPYLELQFLVLVIDRVEVHRG